jgi:hypothetical protein
LDVVYDQNCTTWFGITTGFIGLTMILFLLSSFKDPGYLKKPENISFLVISKFLTLIVYAEKL